MKILCATTSKPKIEFFKNLISDLDVEVVSPKDLNISLSVVEDGKTAQENALIKAMAYHKATGLATIAMDSALYLSEYNESDSIQPGLRVRRPYNTAVELSDDEMIEYYSKLAHSHGGRLSAYYIDGFAIVDETGTKFTFRDYNYPKNIFYLVDKPHFRREVGNPLDTISVNRINGKYYYDQTEEDIKKNKELSTRKQIHEEGMQRLKEFIQRSLYGEKND